MSGPSVSVIKTEVANVASVLAGLRRLGTTPRLTEDAAEIEGAEAVVLPGVGAFGAGMARLRETALVDVLRQRVTAGRPTLAVCLGLQLLCDGSDEDPGVEGLGLLPVQVRRFGNGVRVPQIGWNRVEPDDECQLLRGGHAYFANSYRLVDPPRGWRCARSDHGSPFVAALERGTVLACQFHPELSGPWGLELLGRWLDLAGLERGESRR